MISTNIIEFIGDTRVLKLQNILKESINLYCKTEFLNPGGSIKDRAALQIIQDAYKSNKLKKGQVVVEMTSGNMGSGLALVCKQFGNPFIAVMSKGNSKRRIDSIKSFGAQVVLTEQISGTYEMVTGEDIKYASNIAKQLALEKNAFYVDQFNNSSSLKSHYLTTGPEIINEIPQIDSFVSVIGTGGTFLGTSKFLKEYNKSINCIAVEPEKAAILKTERVLSSRHIIQGTGYGIIPPHWDENLSDDIITVSDYEVLEMTFRLRKEYGLYVGYSSGANVAAAYKYSILNDNAKNIVTILCDTAYKY